MLNSSDIIDSIIASPTPQVHVCEKDSGTDLDETVVSDDDSDSNLGKDPE